jgi:PKHD-type hydroxylase
MLIRLPQVLDREGREQLERIVAKGEFVDGRLTAGYRAKRVKENLQLKKSAEQAKAIDDIVVKALQRHPAFKAAALPRYIQSPLIGRYDEGMAYGDHVDDAIMTPANPVRSDISVTVFLSDPNDYDGGELTVTTSFGENQVKLAAGDGVLYPSSSLHRVAPVTRGTRLVAVTWVESLVRDPGQREILHDLAAIRRFLSQSAPEDEATDLAHKTYSNLLRRWAET